MRHQEGVLKNVLNFIGGTTQQISVLKHVQQALLLTIKQNFVLLNVLKINLFMQTLSSMHVHIFAQMDTLVVK